MTWQKLHHHPCQTCGKKTECGGNWEQNYDGIPEVICREFHLEGGVFNHHFICHDCNEKGMAKGQVNVY